MMKHEESVTDLSSLSSSSSSSSPIYLKHDDDHHPYTVQSPSSQSQDGDKSSVSSNQTGPAYTVQSPSSDSQDGDKSPRTSSTFSSSESRGSSTRRNWNRHKKGWNQCYMIVEEEEEEEEEERVSERWQWLAWGLLAFGLVCLVFWGVATPYRPRVAVKSLAMNNFYFGEGSDYTGVPTKLLTINCTLQMTIRNTASFFGIHISSTSVDLSYLDVTVATGQMSSYYQPRKSQRILSLNLKGNRVPLYGAGSSLALAFSKGGVPLSLGFDIRSHVNVVGKIVKKKHLKHISCSANISPSNHGVVRFKENSCKYN